MKWKWVSIDILIWSPRVSILDASRRSNPWSLCDRDPVRDGHAAVVSDVVARRTDVCLTCAGETEEELGKGGGGTIKLEEVAKYIRDMLGRCRKE